MSSMESNLKYILRLEEIFTKDYGNFPKDYLSVRSIVFKNTCELKDDVTESHFLIFCNIAINLLQHTMMEYDTYVKSKTKIDLSSTKK